MNSKILFTFILFYFSLNATFAIEQGGFFSLADIEKLSSKPKNIERAFNSSVRIYTGMGGFADGHCSAFVLSKSGYVATALHCLKDFLKGSYEYVPNIKKEEYVSEGKYSFLKILEPLPALENVPQYLFNPYNIFDFNWRASKIVWIGNGKQNHQEPEIINITQDEFLQFKDLNEDIVIIKYDTSGESLSTQKSTCVPLAKLKPVPGDRVWAVGYPGEAARENGFSSDGRTEYISTGLIRSSVKEDPILQDFAKGIDSTKLDLYWEREALLYEKDATLVTSVDIVSGNSGGMLINTEGDLEGLIFSVTKTGVKAYNNGNSYAVNMQYVYDKISKDLGKAQAEEIFNCPN